MRNPSKTILIPLLLLALVLGACGNPETPVPTETPTLVPTIAPTATQSSPLALLVLPADLDATQSNRYQTAVYELAQAAGYRFQVRNTLTAADLDPSVKIVVVLPPDPGLLALAASAPQAQFLAVNIPGITPAGNVSVIGQQSRPDLVGFLFGYISAMITTEYDYRIGMVAPQGDPNAQVAFAAFKNGMIYYCGSCPKTLYYFDIYGNDIQYPQLVEIPADEKKELYPAYGNLLVEKKVAMAYVYPTIATPELTNAIGVNGITGIGDVTPNPRPLYWTASLQPDVVKAIQAAWPDLLAGRGGLTFNPPFALIDVDPNLLTPGKQQLVEQVLADLLAGRINIGIGQ
ncbi:MAG: hypothetical protein HY867_10745 [Chloroflexi bacterium]|nr:hypothetical protein [Chloroflexota bacterium]